MARVLVPVDGSDQAHQACEFVVERFPAATMVLVHVINPAQAGYSAQASVPSFSEEWYDQEKELAEAVFDEVEADVLDTDVDTERHIEVGKPTRAIVRVAEAESVDHIVMGSHGRSGVSRILLGSVAEAVVRNAPVSVTVAR
jgi:nucleotide-binding universal stress UspA family protein